MNCIKCGREIPDGELFCVACSLTPSKREAIPASRQQHKTAKPAVTRPAASKRPVQNPAQAAQKRSVQPKRSRKAAVAIIILSILLSAALGFIALSYGQLITERGRLRTREADLQVRENEAAELEKTHDSLSQQLQTAQAEVQRLQTEVDRLNRQLNDSEGSVSQAQYDMSSQQQELERLMGENRDLMDTADELDRQVTDLTGQLTSLTAQVNALTASNEAYSEKAGFMDRYIVFINNDGSKLYHSYGCKGFTRQNFWAYSRKLAESSGFSPCPDCQEQD